MNAPQFSSVDSNSLAWVQSACANGVQIKNLGKANGRAMQLVRFAPGTVFPTHLHTGPEFIYVLEGEAIQSGQRLLPGWVGIAEAGTTDTRFRSDSGCVFLLTYELSQRFC